ERERRVDRQHFLGIDPDLALPRAQRPVDAVIVAPRLDLGHIRYFVRLIRRGQALAPADQRAGRQVGMDLDWNLYTAVERERVEIKFDRARRDDGIGSGPSAGAS